jgi:hypothetical protein
MRIPMAKKCSFCWTSIAKKCYNYVMEQRSFDRAEFEKWIESVGGHMRAAITIAEALECSLSKAEKLVAGRYPSLPTTAEQKVISGLAGRPRDVFFPLVGAKKKRHAS